MVSVPLTANDVPLIQVGHLGDELETGILRRMKRYFVAGNIWLAIAFVAWIGRTYERSDPLMYSFMGVGHTFYPSGYAVVLAVPLAIAAVNFVLYWRTQ